MSWDVWLQVVTNLLAIVTFVLLMWQIVRAETGRVPRPAHVSAYIDGSRSSLRLLLGTADFIRAKVEEKGLSQEQVGAIIGDRAQSYASLRLKGMKPWNTDELDALAPHLGFDSGVKMLLAAHGVD